MPNKNRPAAAIPKGWPWNNTIKSIIGACPACEGDDPTCAACDGDGLDRPGRSPASEDAVDVALDRNAHGAPDRE